MTLVSFEGQESETTSSATKISAHESAIASAAVENTSYGAKSQLLALGNENQMVVKETAAQKSRKHKSMSLNARRRAGGGNLTKNV